MNIRRGPSLLLGACLGVLAGAGPALGEPTEACRLLASRFAAAPLTLDPTDLVSLTNCVATELAARTGAEPGAPPPEPAPPPAPPPNVFPSPPVPSPAVPSPVIPTPEQSGPAPAPAPGTAGQASPGPPGAAPPPPPPRYFGQWPPRAPWVQDWPGTVWGQP